MLAAVIAHVSATDTRYGLRVWEIGPRGTVINAHVLADGFDVREDRSLAFSPDGRFLVLSGAENAPALWDLDPRVWTRRACAIAGRDLELDEWSQLAVEAVSYARPCEGRGA